VSGRRCLAVACARGRAPEQLFCSRHWYELPLELRSRIWRLYRTERGSVAHRRAIAEGELYAATRKSA
jgi:hypothetical protein